MRLPTTIFTPQSVKDLQWAGRAAPPTARTTDLAAAGRRYGAGALRTTDEGHAEQPAQPKEQGALFWGAGNFYAGAGSSCARTAIAVTPASSPAAADCRGGDRLLSGRKAITQTSMCHRNTRRRGSALMAPSRLAE